LLLQAHHALGPTYLMTGDPVSGQAHLEQGIALFDPQQHRSHAFLYGGHDPGVCCLSHAALALWLLGYPDQASRRCQEALALARAYGRAGKAADGLAVLTEALTAVQQSELSCFEPEIHRLKGELLLACAPANRADAEACFRKAIALAGSQRARSWELRAVLSL